MMSDVIVNKTVDLCDMYLEVLDLDKIISM